MRRLLSTLESTFTYIVIDSPPVATCTDGVLISSIVDGVLLVIRGDKSPREIVSRSHQLLREVSAKVFGVVLNNVALNSTKYYDLYHHYYKKSYQGSARRDRLITSTRN
jgi:Mrp family chromosome partitioning ATPase